MEGLHGGVRYRSVNTVVIINGDDDFLKERAALEEASMILSTSILHFSFPEEAEKYDDMIDAIPMDDRGQTIIVWGVAEFPKKILEGCTTIVVAAKGKKLSSNCAKRTICVQKPKSYDDGAEYIRWILKEGERLNIDLKRVASALFVNCGTDLRKTCSEIAKIKVLVGQSGEADPSVVRRVMCFSAELTPRSVVDAVCEGHPAKAIAFYDKLQEGGCETGWILAYMQRHVIQQIRMAELLKSGCSDAEVSSVLGLHLLTFRNVMAPRLGLWSDSSLRQSLDTLCDLDLLHKRGADVSRWGLETEIIRLSEEAKHNVASCRNRAMQGG